ncbi:MAG: hypothetical protein RLZZ09_812 [Pseudomonadota bacterium]|jgi:hypothetical protein
MIDLDAIESLTAENAALRAKLEQYDGALKLAAAVLKPEVKE